MTVLERLKAAGYDPAVSLFPDSIGNAGSMECERIQIRTFFCRPRENEAAIGVTATAMTHFSDGSTKFRQAYRMDAGIRTFGEVKRTKLSRNSATAG